MLRRNQLNQIFTVETIMTPQSKLLAWDSISPLEDVWQKADALKIDAIPVREEGVIQTILIRGADTPLPLSPDWLVTRDTPIAEVVCIFAEMKRDCLLVLGAQDVIGLVTPIDLNKLSARTYFYNLIADMEMQLARTIAQHFPHPRDILAFIHREDRREHIQRIIEDSELELEAIHTLYIREFSDIIQGEEKLRGQLGFKSKNQVEKYFGGIIDLRNAIMHPTRPILDNDHGIQQLHRRLERIAHLLDGEK
jgi:hypothetical protein